MSARSRHAARVKAALLANGGRIERQGNLHAAAGLPLGPGREGWRTLKDTDDGSDGTPIETLRGPRGAVYELSHDMHRIRRFRLREMCTGYRKSLNAWYAGRATLARLEARALSSGDRSTLQSVIDLSVKQQRLVDTLQSQEHRIREEGADLAVDVSATFADVPGEVLL